MATFDLPIINSNASPDDSGLVFFEPLEVAMTLGTATFGTLMGLTMQAPAGADIGLYGKLTIPQNYVGTPVLVIRGLLGEAANTLAFGLQQIAVADSETGDVAFEAEDVASNATWTGYVAEDMYVDTITITPASAYAVGDEVFFFFYRDDSVDTQTGEFQLTGLFFRYNDA
jgi:hypothetical protein